MNWLQLAQAVKRESGLGMESTIVSYATAQNDNARFFQWAQWAARDLTLQREDWRWRRGSATLASTTNQTNTATDFGLTDFASWKAQTKEYRPSAYRVSDGVSTERELTFMSYELFRKNFILGAQVPGTVQCWSISPADELLLGPTPDAAHFVRADYTKTYVEMTGDTSTPAMPERFHMLIVWRALMEYGGFDAAGEVYQRAERNYTLGWPQLAKAQLEQPSLNARSLA